MRREAGSIRGDQVPTLQNRTIIGPSVTRRPEIDASLANMSIVAGRFLEQMRDKVLESGPGEWPLDAKEMREFKNICEVVQKQARIEIDVEKHVMQRTATLSRMEMEETIIHELQQSHVDSQVIEVVLHALGLRKPDALSAFHE
jgi:hypothetical protein